MFGNYENVSDCRTVDADGVIPDSPVDIHGCVLHILVLIITQSPYHVCCVRYIPLRIPKHEVSIDDECIVSCLPVQKQFGLIMVDLEYIITEASVHVHWG